MSKKVKIVIVIAIVVALFGTMGAVIVTKLQTKKAAEAQVENLPDFKFFTLDKAPFTRSNIQKGKPVLVVHFHPECENCQWAAKEMKGKMDLLSDVQVLMVSSADPVKVKEFMSHFELDKYSQVIPLLDSEFTFFKTFGISIVPLEMIYNKDHKLVKYYKGEVRIETIVKLLKGG